MNAAGWTAVLGSGALLGLLLAGVAGWSFPLLALAGAAATWLCALVLDTIAWRRIPLIISADLALDEAEAVVGQLRRRGIEVDLGPLEEDDVSPALAIRSTMRHRRSIHEAITAARHRGRSA